MGSQEGEGHQVSIRAKVAGVTVLWVYEGYVRRVAWSRVCGGYFEGTEWLARPSGTLDYTVP
ncbi:MAG: hypothetical protein RL518_1063 [Pseudomonadota bacterium]